MEWNSTASTPSETSVTGPEDESPPSQPREILVYNRDPELQAFIHKAIYVDNLSFVAAASEAELVVCLRRGFDGLLILGIDSPESLQVLTRLHAGFPSLPIVAIARIAGPELVRDVLRAGATDFLFGSFNTRKFTARLKSILASRPQDMSALQAQGEPALQQTAAASTPQQSPADREPAREDDTIVCRNPSMRRVLEIVETIGPTESTVLIQGESGTGKELIAKRIHNLSKRAGQQFVEVNCGALPESLLESQLFGHEKGSFTGAVHRQVGLFEIADHGTIFLDEIGEMSHDTQVKLLRVLQFREFRRVGGSQTIKVDVRVLAATNKDLKAEVEKKHFRPDLFYRLNVICLQIPPLRERLEEIPDLVDLFCARFAKDRGLPRRTFSQAATEKLQKYRWTGNVRELENAVERLILLAKSDVIDASDLDEHLGETAELSFPSVFAPTLTLDEVKRIHIANVLRENGGNKMKTARILKINVKTLYNLIKSLGIQV